MKRFVFFVGAVAMIAVLHILPLAAQDAQLLLQHAAVVTWAGWSPDESRHSYHFGDFRARGSGMPGPANWPAFIITRRLCAGGFGTRTGDVLHYLV